VGRLVERFGPTLEHAGRRFHGFPSAEVAAEARPAALRACGLSLRKAATLRLVARSIAAGTLTEESLTRMSSEAALRSLTELPGIGPWSAALILLRGLGRLDVFPPGDVGATRGLGALLRPGPTTTLDRTIRRIGDRRGYLYFCSLGSDLLARGLIHPAPPPESRQRERGPSGY
jgi:DNA-3-methyladenine glycosylase II